VQGRVLIVRRPTAFDGGKAVGHEGGGDFLHQTRLPNTGVSTEEYHLPQPLLHLCGPLPQHRQFHLAPNKRRTLRRRDNV
jgi:hypothetical protein